MRGTLQATNLRVVGSSGGSQLTDRLAEKLPIEEPSPPTTKAEASANDALVGRRSGTRKIRTTYADKDPREIMKTLRRGNRNYIDKFDELLDGVEAQLEVCNHSPSPKHLADKKIFSQLSGFMAMDFNLPFPLSEYPCRQLRAEQCSE